MSIYSELRRGPVRGWNPRTRNAYERLDLARRNRTYSAPYFYNSTTRRRPRPSHRDLQFEKKKMASKEKAEIEALEREMEMEEEKNRLEDEKVAELKRSVLMVEDVNLHIYETSIEHHTDTYDCTEEGQLVVRRGQEVRMTFTFQRPWSGKQDDLFFELKLGDSPNIGKGTMVKVKLEEGNDTSYMDGIKKKWGARILKQHENSLTVSVFIPPNAIIGQWEYSVITAFNEGRTKKKFLYEGKDDIIIILNPWCKDDQVYVEDADSLKEYISNEYGCVFNGSWRSMGTKAWFYGHFQEDILEISLHLLRKAFGYEITSKMADPVQISRGLSRIVNACDNNGVLVGRWDGKYGDEVKPTTWKGSVNILRQYYAENEPVKYGQCWVFSHVLTTVARAIGLPCRSVTNFSSSHDTNSSMTIDKFLDDEGNVMSWKSRDSVWNFHVWNEVWMHRPDLDTLMNADGKYDGWHAIDATPQESSDNIFQCGPSPLSAIRCGDVHVGYDTKFIFAEVNAEVCNWRETNNDTILVSKNAKSVGKKISTKIPNGEPMFSSFFASADDNRLDVTDMYKHPEGSVAEREAVMRALCGTEQCDAIFANVTGIEIEFLPINEPKLGDNFTVTAKVINTSSEIRSIRLKMTARPMTYWGEVIGTKWVATDTYPEKKIQPNQFETFDMLIEADSYIDVCDEQLSMSVLAMVYVRDFADHENRVYGSEDFKVKSGGIKIEGPTDNVRAGEPMEIKITVHNSTNKNLTGCKLEIEGGVKVLDKSFEKQKHSGYKKKMRDLKPNETLCLKVSVEPNTKPRKSLKREVEVTFDTKELPDFEGSFTFKMKN